VPARCHWLTVTLDPAEAFHGLQKAPDRFLLGNRQWITRSRFQPLSDVTHAFRLLEAVAGSFNLGTPLGGTFRAEVRVGHQIGCASGEPKAASITLAIARAIGIDVPGQPASYCSPPMSVEGRRP
jgi:hypothetical protein